MPNKVLPVLLGHFVQSDPRNGLGSDYNIDWEYKVVRPDQSLGLCQRSWVICAHVTDRTGTDLQHLVGRPTPKEPTRGRRDYTKTA